MIGKTVMITPTTVYVFMVLIYGKEIRQLLCLLFKKPFRDQSDTFAMPEQKK